MDRPGERNEETHQGAQASLYHTLIEGGERIDEAINSLALRICGK